MNLDIISKRMRIAISFMIIIGVGSFFEYILIFLVFQNQIQSMFYFFFLTFETLLTAILFILFAYFLKRRKKWAWIGAIVILLKETVSGIKLIPSFFINFSEYVSYPKILSVSISIFIIATSISIIIFILVLISLYFLLKERKNYWQISS